MRNLKKFLALVLAMVMAFSLMLSASATDISKFEDQDKVTDEFVEAVAVLTGLNVIKGDGDEENPSIRPQDEITRAEAAALVYRIVTGDINDTQVGLYADYSNFTDVKPRTATDAGDWFAGYVGYCQNAGIIKGHANRFNPYDKVTGYEVLAMILRAVGYGKDGEFEGANWQVNVASLAKTKHISDSVTSVAYNYTLNMNARREIVAELLFRGSLIPQVTWSSALGYNEFDSVITVTGNKTYNRSLASEVFGLYHEGWKEIDMWGNPGYQWKARRNPTSDPARTVATIEAKPSMEAFTDLKRECDIAHALDFDGEKLFTLYVNGKTALTDSYKIVATDTVTKVGGYGRLVKVYTKEDLAKQSDLHWFYEYWNEGNYWQDGKDERNVVTMVDTMLAKVVAKTDSVLDPAGHVITPAKLTVDVYSYTLNGEGNNSSDRRVIAKGATDAANWTQNVGDVILMNAYTNKASKTAVAPNGTDDLANNIVRTGDQTKLEAAAFETNMLVVSKDLVEGKTVKIIDPPTVITGKQTSISWNSGKHMVEGNEKIDALTFDLDAAGTNMNTTYNWYFDQYGYLIGVEETANVRYGVITSVYAAFDQGETNTTGTAKAIATVQYADGTTGTETIDYFMVHGGNKDDAAHDGVPVTGTRFAMDAAGTTAHGTISDAMTAYVDATTQGKNVIQLWPMYDTGANGPMKEDDLGTTVTGVTSIKPIQASKQGVVFMAPVAVSNSNGAEDSGARNLHGILKNNLFKFVKSTNDQTVAVEVAGGVSDTNAATIAATEWRKASQNTGNSWYGGHWAVDVLDDSGNGEATLNKNLASIVVKDDGTGTTATSVTVAYLEKDTQIIFRDSKTEKISTYTLSTLPGNITVKGADPAADKNFSEIDWADVDGDGRAEVVYITGSMAGTVTYGLVYFNGGYSNWDGTTGTANAWLNGEQTTLTFSSLDDLNTIRNANYAGHLFAVRIFNDVVEEILWTDDDYNGTETTTSGKWTQYLLQKYNAGYADVSGEILNASFKTTLVGGIDPIGSIGTTTSAATRYTFQLSTDNPAGGNPYTATTRAVYYYDADNFATDGATVVSKVTYTPDPVGGRITVDTDSNADGAAAGNTPATYYTNPTTKAYGIGNGVVQGDTALAYLNEYSGNDVTIVYDSVSNSVLEIYVAIDPNITPSGDTSVGIGTGVVTLSVPNVSGSDWDAAAAAALKTALKAMEKDQAVFCASVVADTSWTGSKASEMIYFPFTAKTATTATTLTITKTNSDGTVEIVYQETDGSGWTAGTAHFFGVNFTKKPAGSTATIHKALSAGTYSFKIVEGGASGAVLSSGSFTLK